MLLIIHIIWAKIYLSTINICLSRLLMCGFRKSMDLHMLKWKTRSKIFWDDCSQTLFVLPRTALKAVKELNGTFMCGGNVTVGPWSCKLCLACRWRWRNEMMRKERRGSWTSTWGGAIARSGTKSETGAEVGAGVKKGRQDCVPLRHANLIAELS